MEDIGKTHVSNMTTNGQVTIPVKLRRKLGLKPGQAVQFAEDQNGVFIQPHNVADKSQVGIK